MGSEKNKVGATRTPPRPAPPPEATIFRQTQFMLGAARPGQFPGDVGCEVAIVGRSNAGKSSALNVITGLRSLARVSKTPGRTREINFFAVDDHRRLVDLPGYGYARVSADVKQAWQRLIAAYLRSRRSLRGVVVVMDCRHPLTEYDHQMLEWCAGRGVPAHVLLTKADKLSKGAASSTLHTVRSQLVRQFGNSASAQLFSALKRSGVETAQEKLGEWLEIEDKKKAPVKKREEGPGPKIPGLGKPG